MDMMSSIAAASMSMSAARFEQAYDVAVVKKAMEGQQEAAQQLLEMLPPAPRGQYVDVYA